MNKEDFQNLEAHVETLKKSADEAAEALANDPSNADLQQKADAAEAALAEAETELGAAVIDDEDENDDDGHINFEEELTKLNNPQAPVVPTPPANDELTKAQKALFHNTKRFIELGGDPKAILASFETPNAPVVPAVVVTPTVPTPAAPVVPTNTVTKDDMVELEFGKIAKSDAERKVYMHHYNHSIVKTGDMQADMENAMLIANKGRILRSFSEIRRANFIAPRAPTNPGAPLRNPVIKQVSSADATVLRRRGFVQQSDGSWKGKKYTLAPNPKTGALEQTKNK
jgi:hypothetical protein